MSYRAPSYLHGKGKVDDPCVRCDNLPDCANDGKLCPDGKQWELAAKVIASRGGRIQAQGLFRFCSTCGKFLPYHKWVEVRCTLDNEDSTKSYCYDDFLRNMNVYVTIQNQKEDLLKLGKRAKRGDGDDYYDGLPHYRAYGNHPTIK